MASPASTRYEYFSLPDTDLNSFLGTNDRDPRSGLPLGVCSLLLRYLLPQLEVERYVTHRRNPLEKIQDLINSHSDGRHIFINLTGSSVEGLSVPPYRERMSPDVQDPGRAGAPFYQASDVDSMSEVRFLPVEVRQSPGQLYIDEARASHVGYVRVVLDGPADTYGLSFPVRDICRAVKEDGKLVYYLSNEPFKTSLAQVAESQSKQADHKVNVSGPAVNLEPRHSGQRGLDLVPDIDIVTSLPVLGHPPAFLRWLERVSRRELYWPSREAVEDIRLHGRCFVVTTGHVSSPDRDLECRLSFSDPERRLAQTINPIQRKVYLLVKLLQKCYLKEPKVLVTYHLKTIMFWLLEASQPQDWTEQRLFQQVLLFLEKIEGCLQQREIPSYFYPSNNLISHSDPEQVSETLSTVRRIRTDPLRHLYGIDDLVWMGFSTLIPLSYLHHTVPLAASGSESGMRLSLVKSLMQQARQGTMRDILWPLRCADLMRDTYCVLRDMTFEKPGEATGGAEGSVLWLPRDWIVLATIAVFAALQQDEDIWIQKVARVPELQMRKTGSKDPFGDAVNVLLPGRPHAAFMLKMFLAVFSGGAPPPPLDPWVTMKYYIMVGKERVASASRRPKSESTDCVVRQAGVFKVEEDASSKAENEQSTRTSELSSDDRCESTSASHEASSVSADSARPRHTSGARPKDIKHRTPTPEPVTRSAPDLPRLITDVVQPLAEVQNCAIAAVSSPCEPPPTSPTMDRVAGNLQFRETYGTCPALLVELHVAILNVIGCVARHFPRLACRCALWTHALTTQIGGWGPEMTPSVPLSTAPRFLELLPATSGGLLRQPFARAALLPLSAMLVFTTQTLVDENFRQSVHRVQLTDEVLAELFDMTLKGSGDGNSADVEWTCVVMKLCLREMMEQDVHRCLQEVGTLSGKDKGRMARHIMIKHRL